MTIGFTTYVFVCVLVFLAGFIDAAAGGGGLISLPAYYAAGLPPALAAGTNKLSAFAGTFTATVKYAHKKHMPWKMALAAMAGSFPGSFLGAELFKAIPESTVRIIVLVVLPLMALVMLNKDKHYTKKATATQPTLLTAFILGLVAGVYDGLIGPGTGTILQLLFAAVLGLPALRASAASRLVNLGSNIGALISFVLQGKVLYMLGLPAAVFGIMGNWLGANTAIKKGEKFIHMLMLVVMAMLIGKTIYDIIIGGK
ncbi:MAG: TSUP family transporter [Eubacteriales bacterium]|nr:TSUP family transporter [Eubacteriales bacterium]